MAKPNQPIQKSKTNDKSKSADASKGKTSSASAKSAETSHVVANPRLVAAIKSYETSLALTQSYLVSVAEIVQSEQLTRAEVVASLMEARGIEKKSAESQYSRMKAILTQPEVLEAVRNGEMDLKTARESSKKTQTNPSAKKKQENIEKRFAAACTAICNCAKEGGMDRATVINTISSALKKAGVK